MCVQLSESIVAGLEREGVNAADFCVPRDVVKIKGKGAMRRVVSAPSCRGSHESWVV